MRFVFHQKLPFRAFQERSELGGKSPKVVYASGITNMER
jgi:hypothetical protein